MDKMLMLHHLRNPYGVDDIEMREARLQAANELERLYEQENELNKRLEHMTNTLAEYLASLQVHING